MDCRQILSASGDLRKGGNVIKVNEGTYVLKNRWTGPEDKQSDFEDNSGGPAKCRNNEEGLKMKKGVDLESFEVPRENLDTRLRKLMSGDPASIPVFMWEYRADWIHSERKKRHQNKTNLEKGTTEKRSGDKSSDQKIKLESTHTQVSHVEQLLKNVKMTPDLSDKQNETRKCNAMKNYPLEEQLRCDFRLISNTEDLNESFTNPLNDNPIREENSEEIEPRPTIDDVDVDYIVRQFPLEKVSGSSFKTVGLGSKLASSSINPSGLGSKLASSSINPNGLGSKLASSSINPSGLGSKLESSSIKTSGLESKLLSSSINPSGLGSKLTRMTLKDSKPVSAAIHNPLKDIDSKAKVEKNFDQIKESEHKHVKDINSEEVDEGHCRTKIENYNEEKVNVTPNELIKVEPKHPTERVPSRKRKFTEVLGSIEDRFTKEAKLDIKERLEEQIINAAMEKFDKWWEEQELEHEKKGQGLKTEDDPRESF